MLTLERLKSALHYNPETGIFTWLINPRGAKRYAGDEAGDKKPSGYIFIGLDAKRYRAHRLAWFYMKGVWPKNQIDHKDTVGHHNWWSNLREATQIQNSANARMSSNNTSGAKGVSVYHGVEGIKYRAQIFTNGKKKHLGSFDTIELASSAYNREAVAAWGDFASDGR